jgi:two-component system LytT family response regulator
MKNILIVEDEKPAMERLTGMLSEMNESIRIAGFAMSVKQTVEWLRSHPIPDLILMDIALTDGSAFDIFEKVDIPCPVIFITAYDEYWQQAFESNGIDYLLKPVRKEKLEAALLRYDQLQAHFQSNLQALRESNPSTSIYKKRFLVKRGSDWFSIACEDIAYFFAADKMVCLVDVKGQKFVLDQSLTDLEKQLDPRDFNRVNRKFILHRQAIQKAKSYSKSKLLLDILPSGHEDIVISQEYLNRFKAWFGG